MRNQQSIHCAIEIAGHQKQLLADIIPNLFWHFGDLHLSFMSEMWSIKILIGHLWSVAPRLLCITSLLLECVRDLESTVEWLLYNCLHSLSLGIYQVFKCVVIHFFLRRKIMLEQIFSKLSFICKSLLFSEIFQGCMNMLIHFFLIWILCSGKSALNQNVCR